MTLIRSIPKDHWRPDQEPWGRDRELLYIAQEGSDGPFKVGVAGHPTRRLMSLQSGNHRRLHLVRVYAGTRVSCLAVEKFVLKYFDGISGEWFYAELDEVDRFLSTFAEDAE